MTILSSRGVNRSEGNEPPSLSRVYRSHGCIRLHADAIADLFARVSIGTPGHSLYAPVRLASLTDDRIDLEVHRDVYHRGGKPLMRMQRFAGLDGVGSLLD
jgi:hypothetical protein